MATEAFVPTRERDVEDRGIAAPDPKPQKPHVHTPTCGECGKVLEDFVVVNDDGTPTREGWRKINGLLRKPMPTQEFTGRGGRKFKYLTARQVQDRLDTVVGPGNWSTRVRVERVDHPVAVLVGVAIFGVWKWDAGYSNNPDAEPEDKQFEDEPLKAAVSDGFKRAAVQWGIGRWLYGDL